MKYQLDYAVIQTIKSISRALWAPFKEFTIGIEPRTISSDGLNTWDISIEAMDLLIEVKLKPRNEDVVAWLTQVKRDANSSTKYNYRLVYGAASTPLLAALSQMLRLAEEAGSDRARFAELLNIEDGRDVQRILRLLGQDCLDILTRITLHHVTPESLQERITDLAWYMAGESGGHQLSQFLTAKFLESMGARLRWKVSHLIADATNQGITLQRPLEPDDKDLSRAAAAALFVLDFCPDPIPLEILARGTRAESAKLEVDFVPLQEVGILVARNGSWSLTPRPTKPVHPEGPSFVASTLEFLVDYVKDRPLSEVLKAQIRNIKELAQVCIKTHPKIVAPIFSHLDKTLKDLGDKHAVLEIANLSIEASRLASPRTQVEVDAEARALICGKSWAYQRIDRLHEAVAAAERSMQLSDLAGLEETAAFAAKCAGRLARMEAEHLSEGSEDRKEKLERSRTLLETAINKFAGLKRFGTKHPEVGDCYSLLGRTFLVAGLHNEADRMVSRAYRLIEEGTKDHLDLLLLSAELEEKRSRELAGQQYEEALRLCAAFPENSEMRARVLLGRGLNRKALGDKGGACEDFAKAAEIWGNLGEQGAAARAKWEQFLCAGQLPRRAIEFLERERTPVAVKARVAEMYMQEEPRLALASRADPPESYLRQRITKAEQELALDLNEW